MGIKQNISSLYSMHAPEVSTSVTMAGVYVIAVPTLVASCLSFLATSIFGTFHVLVPPPDCGLRHYLVINLLFSGERRVAQMADTLLTHVVCAHRFRQFPQ